MTKKLFFVSFIGFLFINTAFSQITVNGEKLTPTAEIVMKVKQFGEFIERFNYEKTPDNRNVDSAFAKMINRQNYIFLLFNAEDERLKKNNEQSIAYQKTVSRFINHVVDTVNPVFLSRYSEQIYVEAVCKLKYKGKIKDATLLIQNEKVGQNILKWTIIAAKSNFLSDLADSTIIPFDANKQEAIMPNAVETNLISLSRIFKNKEGFTSVFRNNFVQDNALNGFAHGIYSDKIQFMYVQNITYHILSIENWVFVMNEYNRNTKNSGWLISNLLKINDKEKYLNELIISYE